MITKNDHIICDECGLFCIPFDSETPFGCSDYENPEPLDPYHYCKKCSKKLEKVWFERLSRNKRNGDWQKSNAEMKVAKKLGLVWVGSGGIGVLGSELWATSHQYITKKEYEELSKLPYWGFCNLCGKPRKGGSCVNKKCNELVMNYKLKKIK